MKLQFIDITYNALLDHVRLKAEIQGVPVFRFNSLVMYGKPLDALMPLPEVYKYLVDSNKLDDMELFHNFEIAYADQLINYKPSFIHLMEALSVIQEVPEVIILTAYNNPFMMPIVESLISIIKSRYGLTSFIIKDMDDIDPLSYSEFETDAGYTNFIQDVERYSSYVMISQKSAGETWDYSSPDSHGGGENVI